MDYEIDIEEHDVLDNPVIKKIFPDISVIKKEITQYFEEEVAVETQPCQLSKADDKLSHKGANKKNITLVKPHFYTSFENEKTQPIQSNKIILGSKPKSVIQDTNKKLILGSEPKTVTKDDNKELIICSQPNALTQDDRNHILSSKLSHTQNVINKKLILGSKPSHNNIRKVENIRIHEDKLKLKHMKLVLQDIKSYLNQNGRYCKLCCRLFLSKNALDIHKKKVHCRKIICKNKQFTKKINDNKQTRHMCSICGSYFSNNGNLFRHQRNVHQKITFKRQHLKTNFQNSNSTDLQNRRILMKTKSKKIQITFKKTVHKCYICNLKYSTYGNLKRHNDKNHTTNFNLDATEENNRYVLRGKEKRQFTTANKHNGSSSARARHKDISIKENSMPIDKFADKNLEKKLAATNKKHKVATDKESLQVSGESSEDAPVKEDTKPKYVTRAKNNSSKDSSLCLHCKKDFPDQKSLIEHMYEILEPKRNSNGLIKNDNSMTNKEDDKILFVCRQCSYYLPSIKSYFAHMTRNHKTEFFLDVKKEEFDSQCKYCPYKSSSIATYNKHINSYHIDLMFLRIKNEIENEKNMQSKNNENLNSNAITQFNSFALESVLFQCNTCNICFLSSNIARDHNQHNIEMLNNWKCSVCRHILKEQDKEMHLKQHSFSQPIKVYNLNDTALHNVLYNCTKCAIHFTENRYQEHYSNCGSDSTDSYYCSICDILVDKIEMIHHKTQHEHLKEISDFLIVDCNIIVDTSLKKNDTNVESEVRPRKRLHEQHNCLTYCYTCKSFLSDSGLKNKSHIKRNCSHLNTYPCTVCGLVFTSSTLKIHKERHEKDKNFRLQDYKFFNLQGIQVIPPIPEYPHCHICKIHFLSKNAISRHICDETDFLTCDICNIKLSEKTYKLHMSFHFYVLRKTAPQDDHRSAHQTPEILKKPTKRRASEISETSAEFESKTRMKPKILKTSTKAKEKLNGKLETESPEVMPAEVLSNVPDKNNDIVDQEENSTDLIEKQVSNDDSLVVLYTCKNCDVTVELYDEVIKHCQAHYSTRENLITPMKKCKLCSLKFDSHSYLDHERNVHSSVSKIQALKFDPSYFTSKNMIWVKHIFQTLSKEIIKERLKNSIYQHEHRIQLECIQRGSSPLYVYKCDSCGIFIDAGCVYKHAKHPCGKVRKYPCSSCGLPFISIFSRNSHEKVHKQITGLNKRTLNIILFKQKKDKTFNDRIFRTVNEYLLYQCRNCERVAEKSMLTDHVCDKSTLVKCITCGLLISNEDFNAHLNKHTDLGNFCSENFKVILFGRKNSYLINKDASKKLSSCFSGTVYDYTLHECQICKMCLKNNENTEKHTCLPNFDLDRSVCSECGLYFPSGNLKHHIKQHRADPDFVKENINVIIFNDHLSKTNKSLPYPETKNIKTIQIKENKYAEISNDDKETSDDSRNEMFVDDNKKTSEYNKIKINTEIDCSQNINDDLEIEKVTKTSAEDKKKVNKNAVKNDKNNVDYDNITCIDNEMGIHEGENLDDSKMNINDNDVMEENADEGLGILYKCKCGLHFLNKQKVTDHINKCQPKVKQYKQNCSKCHLLFNPSELFSHLVVHHGDKTQVYDYRVIEIMTKDSQEARIE